jgi:hypothetical protein
LGALAVLAEANALVVAEAIAEAVDAAEEPAAEPEAGALADAGAAAGVDEQPANIVATSKTATNTISTFFIYFPPIVWVYTHYTFTVFRNNGTIL